MPADSLAEQPARTGAIIDVISAIMNQNVWSFCCMRELYQALEQISVIISMATSEAQSGGKRGTVDWKPTDLYTPTCPV